MKVRELAVSGAWEFTPTLHGDDRGVFLEAFKADLLAETIGHRFDLAQVNTSVSAAGVLRGIHFADVPPGQAKYVTCSVGSILDVIVDIRVGSPTFGKWDSVLLDDIDRKAVYLSEDSDTRSAPSPTAPPSPTCARRATTRARSTG